MARHIGCGGPVTSTIVPSGYDDFGPMPDIEVVYCQRCRLPLEASEVVEEDETANDDEAPRLRGLSSLR